MKSMLWSTELASLMSKLLLSPKDRKQWDRRAREREKTQRLGAPGEQGCPVRLLGRM